MLGKIISGYSFNKQHNPCFGLNRGSQDNGDVKTSIFYVNDLHGKVKTMAGLKNASDEFIDSRKKEGTDCFRLAGGDMKVGAHGKSNLLTFLWMDLLGFDLSALGNHEFDCGTQRFAEQLDKIDGLCEKHLGHKFKPRFVSTNINISSKSKLHRHLGNFMEITENNTIKDDKKIVKSCVVVKNGHKYGFIGAVPMSLEKELEEKSGIYTKNNRKETVKIIQKEVDRLIKEKGVNKIIMLSHLGIFNEMDLAEKTSGIDIILGAHSHSYIKKIFKSKTNEPVMLLQAGRDGNNYGTLDIIFDSEGHLKIQNLQKKNFTVQESSSIPAVHGRIGKTQAHNDVNPEVEKLKHEILGEDLAPIGKLKWEYTPIHNKPVENPLASFITDAVRKKAEEKGFSSNGMLFMNSSDLLHQKIPAGNISKMDVLDLLPFTDKTYQIKLKGSEIQSILEWGAKHPEEESTSPGLVQVSGIKYTVKPLSDNKVQNIYISDNDKYQKIEPDKEYTILADDFFFKTVKHKDNKAIKAIVSKKQLREIPGFNRKNALIDYIKSFNNKPFKIDSDPLGNTKSARIIINPPPANVSGFRKTA